MGDAAEVDLVTYSDADYSQSFRYQTGIDTPGTGFPIFFDFTGCTMQMMIRTVPEDTQVYLDLTSTTLGLAPHQTGIDIYDPEDSAALPEPGLIEFLVYIDHTDLQQFLPEGAYEQSLIVTLPSGVRWDLWRGSLTATTGPTR